MTMFTHLYKTERTTEQTKADRHKSKNYQHHKGDHIFASDLFKLDNVFESEIAVNESGVLFPWFPKSTYKGARIDSCVLVVYPPCLQIGKEYVTF